MNVLAKEHHELEQSIATHITESGQKFTSIRHQSPRFYDDTDDEEFQDAFDAGKS